MTCSYIHSSYIHTLYIYIFNYVPSSIYIVIYTYYYIVINIINFLRETFQIERVYLIKDNMLYNSLCNNIHKNVNNN